MMTNRKVAIVRTKTKGKKVTIENFQKNQSQGTYLFKCLDTGKIIPFKWTGIVERNEFRVFYKEYKEEYNLKMVA